MRIDTEVFFRPDELARESARIRADLFNRCRAALARSVTDCAFVPVRSMQIQAVVTHDEIVFVDADDYAVRDGKGGRIIVLAWDISASDRRDSLTEPVPIEVVFFHDGARDLHARLMSEFPAALAVLEQHERGESGRSVAEIVPLRRE